MGAEVQLSWSSPDLGKLGRPGGCPPRLLLRLPSQPRGKAANWLDQGLHAVALFCSPRAPGRRGRSPEAASPASTGHITRAGGGGFPARHAPRPRRIWPRLLSGGGGPEELSATPRPPGRFFLPGKSGQLLGCARRRMASGGSCCERLGPAPPSLVR